MKKSKKKSIIAAIVSIVLIVALALVIINIDSTNTKLIITANSKELQKEFNIDNILDENNKHIIKFIDNENEYKYTYQELGIQSQISDEKRDYTEESFIIDLGSIDIEYNTDELLNNLEKLNDNREKTKYAKLKKKDSNIIISKQKNGNYLNINKLYEYILNNINGQDIEIDLTKYYEKIDDTKPTEEELQKEIDKLNNTYVKYTNEYELKLSDLIDYIKIKKNKILFDDSKEDELKEFIDNTIEKELLSYDTVGITREFITHDGRTINISGGTYGNIFSSDDETLYIINLFRDFSNESNRTPIYSQEMEKEIEGTYLEVDIENQKMYHYKDGKLCCSSDIVTGNSRLGRDTPKGVYYLLEKVNGKYLTGDNYRTWVNKWMRVTWTGIGFHDATWRGSFGGSIYKTNGSHGCINLPKSYAYKLYDEVSINDPVIIY